MAHSFDWGDFWRTGMTAKVAGMRYHGIRRDGGTKRDRRQHWIAERTGQRHGVEIAYYRAESCPVCNPQEGGTP